MMICMLSVYLCMSCICVCVDVGVIWSWQWGCHMSPNHHDDETTHVIHVRTYRNTVEVFELVLKLQNLIRTFKRMVMHAHDAHRHNLMTCVKPPISVPRFKALFCANAFWPAQYTWYKTFDLLVSQYKTFHLLVSHYKTLHPLVSQYKTLHPSTRLLTCLLSGTRLMTCLCSSTRLMSRCTERHCWMVRVLSLPRVVSGVRSGKIRGFFLDFP